MKVQRLIGVILVLVLSLVLVLPALADTNTIGGTFVSPNPVSRGGTVFINTQVSFVTTETLKTLTVQVPADWGAGFDNVNPITITSSEGVTWTRDTSSACVPTTVNGVTMVCETWTNSDAVGGGFDNIELSFAVSGSATIGSNRPVQVKMLPGDGGAAPLPYLETVLVSVQDAVTTTYASDDPFCEGFGVPGTSCFSSLDAAFAVTSASTVFVVGDLTLPAGGFTWNTQNATVLRGTSDPVLKYGGSCSDGLNIAKNNVTMRDVVLDGSGCSGVDGVDITATGVTLSTVTVRDFTGANGVETTQQITAKGNVIIGNGTGLVLPNAGNTNVYANQIESNTGFEIVCNGGTGAAYNWLGGGTPPTFGSSNASGCTDSAMQLGSNFVNWGDVTFLNEIAVTSGAGVTIFDLGVVPPWNVGTIDGVDNINSNYYLVKGTGDVLITAFGTQYKFNQGACTSTTDNACWNASIGDDAPGYFVKGNTDPTAVVVSRFGTANNIPWGVVAAAMLLALIGAAGLVLYRRNLG